MKSRNEYIEHLRDCGGELRKRFGVRSLLLFGSVARNEHNDTSDIDVCVEMDPNLFLMMDLKEYLESSLGCNVDVVRENRNMNPYLRKWINRDGIKVF